MKTVLLAKFQNKYNNDKTDLKLFFPHSFEVKPDNDDKEENYSKGSIEYVSVYTKPNMSSFENGKVIVLESLTGYKGKQKVFLSCKNATQQGDPPSDWNVPTNKRKFQEETSTEAVLMGHWGDNYNDKKTSLKVYFPKETTITHSNEENSSSTIMPGETVYVSIWKDSCPENLENGPMKFLNVAGYKTEQGKVYYSCTGLKENKSVNVKDLNLPDEVMGLLSNKQESNVVVPIEGIVVTSKSDESKTNLMVYVCPGNEETKPGEDVSGYWDNEKYVFKSTNSEEYDTNIRPNNTYWVSIWKNKGSKKAKTVVPGDRIQLVNPSFKKGDNITFINAKNVKKTEYTKGLF